MKNVILTHSASLLHFLKCNGHEKQGTKICFQEAFESILCYA